MQPGESVAPIASRHGRDGENSSDDRDADSVFVLVAPETRSASHSAGAGRPHFPFVRRSSTLLPLASMPRTRTANSAFERFTIDSPISNADAMGIYPQLSDQPYATPYYPSDDPRSSRRYEIADAALSSGATRQLAALYIHVDLTTVERVRWLAFFTILLYLLTCWFCRYYVVATLGVATGLLGIVACWRPHYPAALKWVKAFVALNYVVMLALVLVMIRTVAIDLPRSARSTSATSGNNQAVQILVVLVVPIAWLLHWRTQRLARMYVREFRMIEQLGLSDQQDQPARRMARQLSSTSSLSSSSSVSESSTTRYSPRSARVF